MRVRMTFLACAALLASTWAVAQVPRGDYLQSCVSATVAAKVLRAKCRTTTGALVDTSLKLPCGGPIENINGKLTCAPLPPIGVPDGSYLQSCSGASVSGGVQNRLKAYCKTPSGAVVASSLSIPCRGRIDNVDGQLTCVK